MRLLCIVAVPAALGLILMAGPLLATVFNYGEFSAYDTRMAEASLRAYGLGLVGFTLVKVLAPGYYARQDTRAPVRVGVIAVAANILLNMAITIPMLIYGFRAPHAGLALSTSLAAFLNAGLLYRGLRTAGVYRPGRGWRSLLVRATAANLAMGGLLWWRVGALSLWLERSASERVAALAFWIFAAIVVYLGVLWLTGLRLKDLRAPAAYAPYNPS
jgi:putative peptidoglycan lipid II flippase